MNNNFIKELEWRGMLHNIMENTEEQLNSEMTVAYIGFDPTADSLHIGHLVSIMILKHFQKCGHKPIALVGGATGMIGDPSMKSNERNLLDEQTLNHNLDCLKKQLSKFLDFESDAANAAEMVNNYDWMKDFSFLDFTRDIGKHITVNYMMAKDSVKKRLSGDAREGMSFTEFTYQLIQGYDFLHLYRTRNCRMQLGGSDQWGNITTGTELIRRIDGGTAFGITCPLITKADGGKFGKTEQGNIWLDPAYTSPYRFYQFWHNVSDDDAKRYIKIFTMLDRDFIERLIAEHDANPHIRLLQKTLAKEITCMVHSEKDYNNAVEASMLLFGKGNTEKIAAIDEATLLEVFEGVPRYEISRKVWENATLLDLFTQNTPVVPSKGELRKLIRGGGFNINEEKITDENIDIHTKTLLQNKYLLVRKGKKDYSLIVLISD
ncbi:MAG: tyrosine--tRNA ligase [Prevotellaceae bacterium]|jgi:tyrosyl-tRNA synthetase|nr:tyrosine--tRNA ligase [Prevotellaceae bacterium]